MKKHASILTAILLSASAAQAGNVGFDLNINLSNRPPQVAPPPPVAVPVHVPAPPILVFENPPVFIAPASLGFYAAVGVPYDLFYVSGDYYLFRGNVWYHASHYNGPWVSVDHKRLPPGLHKHKVEKIRSIRDDEYRIYQGQKDRYRGKHFKPDKEGKERRKAEKRAEKEERKQHKHHRNDD